MANARDLFDPTIQQAQFVGDRVAGLKAADVIAQGGELVAQWEFRMDSNAQLTALERIVKTDSLGKVFGDGEVFAAIPDTPRTANVSMFKMKDGSGVQIAQLTGGERAMEVLLSKASQDDLDLMPKYRAPKPKAPAVQEAKQGTLVLGDGNALKVILEDKKVEAPAPVHREPIPLHRAAGAIAVPMHNPVAAREFIKRAMTATSQAMPMQSAADMPIAAMVAASPEVHPEDTSWPEGITVVDVRNGGAAIESPKRAMVAFAAALEGREGPVITRDDVLEQFKTRKNKM